MPHVDIYFGLFLFWGDSWFDIYLKKSILFLDSTIFFCGILVLSILVDVLIVNLFYIFLLESTVLVFYWNSLAKRNAVALASFLRLSTLLFLQPSMVV